MVAGKLHECLTEWAINPSTVLTIVTDNGSNMIKAVNDLKEMTSDDSGQVEESDGDRTEDSSDETEFTKHVFQAQGGKSVSAQSGGTSSSYAEVDDEAGEDELEIDIVLKRFPCVAHTIQLVIKSIEKHEPTMKLIMKATHIVKSVRKSSVATQSLLEKAGKTLVKRNSTRWNSTLFMIQRLIEVRQPLNEVLDAMRLDSLLASEWARLEELYNLLKPIQCHTDIMQSDTMVLSNVIPALVDLSYHFQEPEHPKALALPLLKSLRQRLACVLDSEDLEFNATAAAACFLDPTVAVTLFSPDMEALMKSAQQYI
jgi:hypothetical protein